MDFHGVIADLVHAVATLKGATINYDTLTWNDPLMDNVWDILKEPRLYEVMKPYEDCYIPLCSLSKDYYIKVVTNSPQETQSIIMRWLKDWKIPFDEVICTKDKSSVKGEILIDDYTTNINDWWIYTAKPTILMDRPWNRNLGYPSGFQWKDVEAMVRSYVLVRVSQPTIDSGNATVEGSGPTHLTVEDLKRAKEYLAEPVEIHPSGAKREVFDEVRYDLISPIAMRRIAETYAEGSIKYGDRNWEKGLPFSNILNHVLAHIYEYMDGASLDDDAEDNLAHAAWGLIALMHYEREHPECNDLPWDD